MEIPFSHLVLLDGEPVKRFRSLREAKWFTDNKSNATIVKLVVQKRDVPKELYEELGEAPF